MSMADRAVELLTRNLSRRDTVSPEEKSLLASLRKRVQTFHKGVEIISQHSRPSTSCLLVAGMTARSVLLADSRRQLTALHVPGDFVDLHALLLRTMDHSIVALDEVTVVFVPHEDLIAITREAPHLTRLLWLCTAIDAAIHREMMTSIGRRSPASRLAQVICEIYLRMEVIGQLAGNVFSFPLTQTELSDLLGLSVVHTNRTVQDLRATRLISWQGSTMTVHDFDALCRFSRFDPTYLNLVSEPR